MDTQVARSWLSGLRRSQSRSRGLLEPLAWREGRFRVYPIYDWTDRDVWQYLQQHYEAVPAEGLPPDYRLLRRTQ